jgi:hypothetical protein
MRGTKSISEAAGHTCINVPILCTLYKIAKILDISLTTLVNISVFHLSSPD